MRFPVNKIQLALCTHLDHNHNILHKIISLIIIPFYKYILCLFNTIDLVVSHARQQITELCVINSSWDSWQVWSTEVCSSKVKIRLSYPSCPSFYIHFVLFSDVRQWETSWRKDLSRYHSYRVSDLLSSVFWKQLCQPMPNFSACYSRQHVTL